MRFYGNNTTSPDRAVFTHQSQPQHDRSGSHENFDTAFPSFPQLDCLERQFHVLPNESPYGTLTRRNHDIRLIEILDVDHDNGNVRCRTTRHSLSRAAGHYIALSYTWGQPDRDCTIEINGRRMPVRKNLWRLLHHMHRHPKYKRKRLWIDALCINQSDRPERERQVGLMASIYKHAAHVLVWLGPSYGDSNLAMRALTACAADPSTIQKIWWRKEGSALRRLFERGYWTRLWVLQELTLAGSTFLMCGSQLIPWRVIKSFFFEASSRPPRCRREQNSEYEPTLQSHAASMLKQIDAARQNPPLFDTMLASKELHCSDPRDKVYALLGIVQREQSPIYADYTMDLSRLLNLVLLSEHRKRRPANLHEVKVQCRNLTASVGVSVDTIFQAHLPGKFTEMFDFRATGTDLLTDPVSKISICWACYYGHAIVQDLWIERYSTQGLNDAFLYAAASGNEPVCKALLANKAVNVNYSRPEKTDSFGKRDFCGTPLTAAARNGHEGTVKLLLAYEDIQITSWHENNRTAVGMAAARGHARVVEILMESIASRPQLERVRMIPPVLADAAAHGELEAMNALLSQVDQPWFWSAGFVHYQMALLSAARRKQKAIVSLLVSHLNLSQIHKSGGRLHSLLDDASQEGHVEIVRGMLQSEDFRAEDVSGSALVNAVFGGHEEIVAMLLARKDVSANQTSNLARYIRHYMHRETPLTVAIWFGREKILKLLLQSGKNLDVSGHASDFVLALSKAASQKYDGVLKLILADENLVVNWNDLDGVSVACLAAHNGYASLMELLLERGDVDVNAISMPGHALWTSKDEAADYVVDTPLRLAARHLHSDVVRLLLTKERVDVNLRSTTGALPILTLGNAKTLTMDSTKAATAKAEIANALLQREDLLVPSEDMLRWTIDHNDHALMKALLASGRVNVNESISWTRAKQNPKTKKSYVEKHISKTALSYAMDHDLLPMVELILESGQADLDSMDIRQLRKRWPGRVFPGAFMESETTSKRSSGVSFSLLEEWEARTSSWAGHSDVAKRLLRKSKLSSIGSRSTSSSAADSGIEIMD